MCSIIPTTIYPLIIDCMDSRPPLKLTKLARPATSWVKDLSIKELQLKSKWLFEQRQMIHSNENIANWKKFWGA